MVVAWMGTTDRRVLGAPVRDALLAVVMAVLCVLDIYVGPGEGWLGPRAATTVLVPLLALTLAWRRVYPTAVLTIFMALLSLMSILFGGSETSTAVFVTVIAIYSGAFYARSVLYALVVVVVPLVIWDFTDPLIETFGDRIWAFLLGGLTFLVGLGMRGRAARSRELELRAAALEAQQREVADAIDEERRRIARELHDIVSHSLGVLVLQAGAAAKIVEKDPARAREVLVSIRETGMTAIGEMGTLLGLMRGDAESSREPAPNLADLDPLAGRMRQAGLPVTVQIDGEVRRLPAAVELSAFRIVQEGLTNVLKHAPAATATVHVRFADTEVEIEVTDDGSGDAPAGAGSRRGLAGLGERVAVFGGRWHAGPRPDGGWTLRAFLPVPR
jgi:signal transduction histidine kinase